MLGGFASEGLQELIRQLLRVPPLRVEVGSECQLGKRIEPFRLACWDDILQAKFDHPGEEGFRAVRDHCVGRVAVCGGRPLRGRRARGSKRSLSLSSARSPLLPDRFFFGYGIVWMLTACPSQAGTLAYLVVPTPPPRSNPSGLCPRGRGGGLRAPTKKGETKRATATWLEYRLRPPPFSHALPGPCSRLGPSLCPALAWALACPALAWASPVGLGWCGGALSSVCRRLFPSLSFSLFFLFFFLKALLFPS